MSADTTDRTDAFFRALASKPRREILRMLATGAGEGDSRCCGPYDVCACRFSEDLEIGASTISHHMKILVEAGLVSSRKQGLWVYYRLVPERFAEVLDELRAFMPSEGWSAAAEAGVIACGCDSAEPLPAEKPATSGAAR